MKNSENLYYIDKMRYENLDKMCRDAYNQGRRAERALAIEAYRLRCSNLFGNRCMSRSLFGRPDKKICDGDCRYLNQYRVELYRLETSR